MHACMHVHCWPLYRLTNEIFGHKTQRFRTASTRCLHLTWSWVSLTNITSWQPTFLRQFWPYSTLGTR